MYFPSGFSLPAALYCSELVITAYDMYKQWVANPSHFNWIPNGPPLMYSKPIWGNTWWFPYRSEPFAFVACSTSGATAGNIYFVARGSETLSDWADDFDVTQKPYSLVQNFGKVHAGFMDIYATMSAGTIAAVNTALQQLGANVKALYFTAHSLGSALSTLALPDVLNNSTFNRQTTQLFHYPLASPRVGDPDFYYQYGLPVVPTYRIIDTEDIVPDLPPSVVPIFGYIYKHIGLEVSYTAQYDSDAGNHNYRHSYHYALKNPYQPEGPIVQQIAEDAATKRFLRLKEENDLLKRLVAEREAELSILRSQAKP